MKIVTVIPAKNEYLTIYNLVQQCKTYGDVIVVNDGSSDNTAQLAQLAGAHVISHHIGKHIAQSVLDGFRIALSHYYSCAIIIQMDAGGSHNPSAIPRLVKPIQDGRADMTIGSRLLYTKYTGKQTLLRRLLTQYGSWAVRKLTGMPYRDLTSGYKAFRTDMLHSLQDTGKFNTIKSYAHGFQFEFTHQIWLAGYRIKEIPIYYIATNSSLNCGVFWDAILTLWRVWGRRK